MCKLNSHWSGVETNLKVYIFWVKAGLAARLAEFENRLPENLSHLSFGLIKTVSVPSPLFDRGGSSFLVNWQAAKWSVGGGGLLWDILQTITHCPGQLCSPFTVGKRTIPRFSSQRECAGRSQVWLKIHYSQTPCQQIMLSELWWIWIKIMKLGDYMSPKLFTVSLPDSADGVVVRGVTQWIWHTGSKSPFCTCCDTLYNPQLLHNKSGLSCPFPKLPLPHGNPLF